MFMLFFIIIQSLLFTKSNFHFKVYKFQKYNYSLLRLFHLINLRVKINFFSNGFLFLIIQSNYQSIFIFKDLIQDNIHY